VTKPGHRPLRLAVVGAGWAGRRQGQAIAELGGAIELVCLVDNDAEHLRSVAAEQGIERTTTDVESVLGDPEIDAVSICTPHRLHAPMSIAAARAGKHVLVEKPMASTVAEATAMIEAADSQEVRLVVAENQVYEPSTRRLAELVSAGEGIGNLAFAAVVDGYRAPDPRYDGRRDWLTRPEAGGTGTWMLQGIHTVARTRHIFGEIASVYVREHRTPTFLRPDLEATMSGLLVLQSGVSVWLVQTPEVALQARMIVQLYGDEGVVLADANGYEMRSSGQSQPARVEYPVDSLSSFALELRAFANEVATDAVAPTSGRSERRSLAVVEAGLESARTGLPVSVAERYPGL
jgi:UDP-N-acetylglucosamine 3-dehydrogenase